MRYVLGVVLVAAGLFLQVESVQAQKPESARGSQVLIQDTSGVFVRGELLGVDAGNAWLLSDNTTQALPLMGISTVEVQGRGIDRGTIGLWALIGGLVSGIALTAACAGVEDSECAGVFAGSVISWGVAGGLSALATRNPHRTVEARPEAMAPYARFPQGIPPEFAP